MAEHSRRIGRLMVWAHDWVEVLSALLLAVATVGTAWCAYQASIWGGIQTFRISEANAASRRANEMSIEGYERRILDLSMLEAFLEAQAIGDQGLMEFYLSRFQPGMKEAMQAWLATRPMENPDAPALPFTMPEYVVPETAVAQQAHALSEKLLEQAKKANHTSDLYVFASVLWASVLFFAGIASKFKVKQVRHAVLLLAFLAIAVALARVLTIPVSFGD